MDERTDDGEIASLRTRRLRALNLFESGVEPSLDALARVAARICDVPIALVTLLDGQRQWFKGRVGVQISGTPIEHAFCALALRDDRELVVADAREDPRFVDNPLVTGEPHIRFYAGVPIRIPPNLPVGTLCVIDTRPRRLDESQLALLRALAGQADQILALRDAHWTLERLREHEKSLERRLRDVERSEALRIASELHDGLGQDLLGMQLSLVELLVRRDLLDERLATRIAELSDLVGRAVKRCREMAYAHTPYSTEELGLARALDRYCERLREASGRLIECSVPASMKVPLDAATSEHLLRIAQEAIRNALRHAGALRIDVSLLESQRRLWLTVEDDGRGLPPGVLEDPGAGLRGMLFRAEEIGATLTFQNLQGSGLQVECVLPLPLTRR
jgi:signal transduction histidine kinase